MPADFVIPRQEVIKNLESLKDEDFIAFIGHATFLIKLGDTTIITDPHRERFWLGKRYISYKEIKKSIKKIERFISP